MSVVRISDLRVYSKFNDDSELTLQVVVIITRATLICLKVQPTLRFNQIYQNAEVLDTA